MAPPPTAPAVKGASQLANKWALLLDTTPTTTATWLPMFGISQFTPNRSYVTQDNTDFDSDGWASSMQTQRGWSVTGGVQRKRYAGEEDAGQRYLRRAAETATDVHVLYFDRYFGEEAFEGYASPLWEPQGGGATDLESSNFTLNGQGALVPVTNPLWVAPTITSITPTSPQAAGVSIVIKGTGFALEGGGPLTAATAVKFGADNAVYTVDSPYQLRATVPAGASGAANITITNPWGTSTPFTFARP